MDSDDAEIERFAQSVAALALERKVKSNFSEFTVRARAHVFPILLCFLKDFRYGYFECLIVFVECYLYIFM